MDGLYEFMGDDRDEPAGERDSVYDFVRPRRDPFPERIDEIPDVKAVDGVDDMQTNEGARTESEGRMVSEEVQKVAETVEHAAEDVAIADETKPPASEDDSEGEDEDEDVDSTALYVGNLTWWVTDHDLEDFFKPLGDVKDIHIYCEMSNGKSKGYARVTFADHSSARRAKRRALKSPIRDCNPIVNYVGGGHDSSRGRSNLSPGKGFVEERGGGEISDQCNGNSRGMQDDGRKEARVSWSRTDNRKESDLASRKEDRKRGRPREDRRLPDARDTSRDDRMDRGYRRVVIPVGERDRSRRVDRFDDRDRAADNRRGDRERARDLPSRKRRR